jgi:hypothetical protein
VIAVKRADAIIILCCILMYKIIWQSVDFSYFVNYVENSAAFGKGGKYCKKNWIEFDCKVWYGMYTTKSQMSYAYHNEKPAENNAAVHIYI